MYQLCKIAEDNMKLVFAHSRKFCMEKNELKKKHFDRFGSGSFCVFTTHTHTSVRDVSRVYHARAQCTFANSMRNNTRQIRKYNIFSICYGLSSKKSVSFEAF